MKSLEVSYGSMDVQNFMSLFQEGRLNLEPGFQRQSVWTITDRKKLMQSIFQNYPVPSIFLYRTKDDKGRLKYDVLDGKQRLESILMFCRMGKFRTAGYEVKAIVGEDGEAQLWDWNKLKKAHNEHVVTGYKVQTVEVSGSLGDIIDLFVRINSTGKRLTTQEKRHAAFFNSPFLKLAGKLAEKYESFLITNKVLTKGQTDRMKDVELICELMASIHMQQLLNKKSALDKIIGGANFTERSLIKVKEDFVRILNLLGKVFPNIKATRFAFSAEFYSVFMLLWELDKAKHILTDPVRNKQAQKLIEWMSNGVDQLRSEIAKAKGARNDQQLFAAYLFTTRGDSDSITTRKRRADILSELLGGVFEQKDSNRLFTKEQRRLIWNSDSTRTCAGCKEKLTWENFTVDHIKPHALGGPSDLSNAASMCRQCNSKKGTRRAAVAARK